MSCLCSRAVTGRGLVVAEAPSNAVDQVILRARVHAWSES